MKIVLAVDGSIYTEMSARMLAALELPSNTEIIVMTVIPEITFLGGFSLQHLKNQVIRRTAHKTQEKVARELLQEPVKILKDANIDATIKVTYGKPAENILNLAHDTKADLIVIGAKGINNSSRFHLGSVSQKVMKYSNTSVLLTREKPKKLRSVLVATDGSNHAEEAVRFLLNLPLPLHSKVVLVTSLESHISVLVKMQTLNMDVNQKVIKEFQEAEEKAAQNLLRNSQEHFTKNGYNSESLTLKGYAAEEIIKAAKTLNPDIIVLGAKGLDNIETFLLGSVVQRVARFSRYSVLIVKH